jgi:hypothetical protein
MAKRKPLTVREQVVNGFRTTGWILTIFSTMLMLYIGAVLIFGADVNRNSILRSRAAGWGYLLLGSVIVVSTVSRWRKILPGVLIYAVLNGLVMIQSGHVTNRPDVPVPQGTAIALTLLFAATGILSATFVRRKINVFDRVALISVPAGLVWAPFIDPSSLLPLFIPFLALLAAWAKNRYVHRPPTNPTIMELGVSTPTSRESNALRRH